MGRERQWEQKCRAGRSCPPPRPPLDGGSVPSIRQRLKNLGQDLEVLLREEAAIKRV